MTAKPMRPPSVPDLIEQARHPTLESIVVRGFESLQPHERLSVSQAAERYMRIGTGGGHSTPWSAKRTPYLVEPMDLLTSLDYQGMIFVGPARTGKALAIDTPIATPEGWTTMGDLRVGDRIFGADGRPTTVTFVTPIMHNRQCYRVKFNDGSELIADAEHQWKVRDVVAENEKVVTTKHMVETGVRYGTQRGGRKRFAIRIAKPLQTDAADLPIDPYVFGAWLGDGCKVNATLACGREDYEQTRDNIEARGYKVRCYVPSDAHRCYTLAVAGPDGVWLDQYLSTYGPDRKAIPQKYLRASEHQRRELLRGLCDTDGTIEKRTGRRVAFTTVEPALAEQVAELARSLGFRVKVRVKEAWCRGKRHRDAYEVQFVAYDPNLCFSMKRKIDLMDLVTDTRETQTNSLFIDSIEPVESVPVRCIQVDSADHLFLAGRSMIPTHNTMMSLAWLTHTALTDPADMMFVHMDRENARKWSKGDLERFLQASSEVRAHQLTNRKDDNTFDKEFDTGMRFLLTYPTASNLSGITVPRGWLIDYERMDDNVDGEGNPFDLLQMRTTTFKRFGMTVAEASPNPNKEIQDPKWTPGTPHEAPPIRGIFELYNRGDRRRWYWCCPDCREAFEPDFKLLRYPDTADIMEAREKTYMACPHCGAVIEPATKDELNLGGQWVRDGMMWLPREKRVVERNGMKAARSSIASFWMKGPAAAYQDWGQLVEKYLRAMKALEETGDDAPLRKTVTTDQGSYYIPQSRLSERSPEELKSRAEDWGSTEETPTVPRGVRFLIATADVQKHAFVAQVHGFTATGDMVVIDAFKLRLSNRLNENGERLPIDPAAFREDWDVLVEVLQKTYPLADGSGRQMRIRALGCDSGGEEGVTTHAYNTWRKLRKDDGGLHRRFCLLKGEPSKTWPHAHTSWPDSKQKGKKAIATGDVPVVMLNSNLMKDRISNMLARRTADAVEGETVGGMLRYPDWMPEWFYNQMTTEIRTAKGWENPRKRRNEAFDLAYYALGMAIRPVETVVPYVVFNIDRLNFNEAPGWAAEWDDNDFVVGETAAAPVAKARKGFADLGGKLA